ncbi:hypothetical protein [Pseudomonas sp. C5pp]|uniref:hypothetical protein n=1 Tax=Pseudomonas sp. C5pp TaxID=1586081 RepID=UPI00057FD5D2|nr:hypothetical protein [Pseudomonas sp. C5pp]KIC80951.1 hypothetical protein RR51_18585 [Pseudomonas sp. C5pp]
MPWLQAKDVTTDPVEGEVRSAVAAYKMALVMTHHQNWAHRLACWAQDQEALRREAILNSTKKRAQEVLGKSPEHRVVLENIVKSQPRDIAEKDNLLSLMTGSLKI